MLYNVTISLNPDEPGMNFDLALDSDLSADQIKQMINMANSGQFMCQFGVKTPEEAQANKYMLPRVEEASDLLNNRRDVEFDYIEVINIQQISPDQVGGRKIHQFNQDTWGEAEYWAVKNQWF